MGKVAEEATAEHVECVARHPQMEDQLHLRGGAARRSARRDREGAGERDALRLVLAISGEPLVEPRRGRVVAQDHKGLVPHLLKTREWRPAVISTTAGGHWPLSEL